MTAGKLRHRIEIQQNQSTTSDSYGAANEDWQTIATRWASVTELSGTELERAHQVAGDVTHRVIIRYCATATRKHRIKYGSRVLDINHVNDVDGRGIEMILLCKGAD